MSPQPHLTHTHTHITDPATQVDDPRSKEQVAQVLESVLGTKYAGYQTVLAPYVAQACISVMPSAPKKPSLNVDSVRVCKLQGGTIGDSTVMKGIVVSRDTAGTIKRAEKAKVAVFGCGIEASSTETKGTVLIRNAEDLLNYNKGEEKLMEDIIKCVKETSGWGLRRGRCLACDCLDLTSFLSSLFPPTNDPQVHRRGGRQGGGDGRHDQRDGAALPRALQGTQQWRPACLVLRVFGLMVA